MKKPSLSKSPRQRDTGCVKDLAGRSPWRARHARTFSSSGRRSSQLEMEIYTYRQTCTHTSPAVDVAAASVDAPPFVDAVDRGTCSSPGPHRPKIECSIESDTKETIGLAVLNWPERGDFMLH